MAGMSYDEDDDDFDYDEFVANEFGSPDGDPRSVTNTATPWFWRATAAVLLIAFLLPSLLALLR